MRTFLIGIFGSLMNWWGIWLIAAMDSTMVFFLPLAVDIAVIVLAFFYGRQIIRWFQSDTFEYIAYFLFGAAMLGTTLAVIQLIRSTRRTGHKTRRRAA